MLQLVGDLCAAEVLAVATTAELAEVIAERNAAVEQVRLQL
jgi:hypothetical protein